MFIALQNYHNIWKHSEEHQQSFYNTTLYYNSVLVVFNVIIFDLIEETNK